MGAGYKFSIMNVTDSLYSHSGSNEGTKGLELVDLDDTVSIKANARWYDSVPKPSGSDDKQSYQNSTGEDAYVVYDPNGTNKNDNNDQFANYKGMIWLTTNASDGTYPTIVYLKDGTVRNGYHLFRASQKCGAFSTIEKRLIKPFDHVLCLDKSIIKNYNKYVVKIYIF